MIWSASCGRTAIDAVFIIRLNEFALAPKSHHFQYSARRAGVAKFFPNDPRPSSSASAKHRYHDPRALAARGSGDESSETLAKAGANPSARAKAIAVFSCIRSIRGYVAGHPITMDDALAIALYTNRTLASSIASLEAAELRTGLARAQLNPTFGVNHRSPISRRRSPLIWVPAASEYYFPPGSAEALPSCPISIR